ncbi:MAG: DUF3788 domain-containing protein [Gemmatimonadota bacterium]|nr:MAG: DUF3788 domain-containing protein [Gemmatimonadota bacterium]
MTSFFMDKSVKPEKESLARALGKTAKLWDRLRSDLEDEYGELVEDWKFYSQKSGWTMKLLRKKRNLFFMTPHKGYFRVTFVFGDKAVFEVEKSDIPGDLIKALLSAKKYAEGRGLTVGVKNSKDRQSVRKLVDIKARN